MSSAEPVFVFGTDLAGNHDSDSARLAAALYGAETGCASGETGAAYALPSRNSDGQLLGLDVIRNYVDPFLEFAAARAERQFRIARFGCEKDAHSDADMASLFRNAPPNCRLPGVWQRTLDPSLPARLLMFDPGAHLKQTRWQEHLRRYLDLNVPLWGVPGVVLVSIGSARAVVANDIGARALDLRHRVFGPDEKRHGRDALVAAEAQAVWYSTHLLSVFDFDQTAHPQQIRIVGVATRNGLEIDQLNATEV